MLGRSRAFAATLLCVALSAAPMPAAAATGPTSVDVRLILNMGSSDLDTGDAFQIAFSETMDTATAGVSVLITDPDGTEASLSCGVSGTACTWNAANAALGGVNYGPGRVLSVTVGAIVSSLGTTPGLQVPATILGSAGITAPGLGVWDVAASPDRTIDAEADAPSFRWTALQRSAHSFFADESTDSIADIPRGFTREWSAAIFKEPRGDPEWATRIQITTGFDPTTLTTYPEAVPTITPPTAVYQWASTTNTGPQPTLTSRAVEVLATGLSLERNVYGGRDIGAGTTVRRTFTVAGRTSQSFRSIQLSITLGPQAGQAVIPSAVACAQPPNIYGSQYDWSYNGVAAGTELLVQCDVTLTNPSTSAARWTPHIVLYAQVSANDVAAPPGAMTIVGTRDIGETRFTIEPPGGTNVQGTLHSFVQRLLSLRGENRTTAPLATQWTAQSNYTEFISLPDDIALDAVRPMQRSWGRYVYKFDGSPPWPVSITLDTTADISVFPEITPVPTAGGSRYRWDLETGAFAGAFGRATRDAAVGFDLSRSLVGGREIAPGATERRRFTLDMTATTDVPSLNVVVYFVNFAQPGSTAPPVTASDVSCTPAPTFNFDPLRPQWSTGAAPRGTALHIACDLTLRNTTSARAMYMPGVSASQGRSSTVVLPPGEGRAVHVDPVLGTTEFVVSPPAGVAHAGRLISFESHQVELRDENRGANAVQWYSTISTDLFAFDPGDAISSAPRSFSRSFNLFSSVDGGASWPTTIDVTTQLPASDLSAFPSVPATIGPDGATYRWSGTQPYGISGSLRQLTPVTAQPTLAVSRRLDGGREIPAGATVTRQLTATIEVAAESTFLVVTVMFRPFVPPGGVAPPVTASEVSCPGATFYPFDLTTARWFALAGGVGQTHTLTCTVRLTNTSDRPARYMPEVSVQSNITSVHSTGTDRFTVDDPVLGRASVAVTPPSDVVATGRFLHLESRRLVLGHENAVVSAVPWSFFVTASLDARTAEDAYADSESAFSRAWSFSLHKPAGWGASIAATTALDTTGWLRFPEVAPTTGATGTTFRWETTDPSLFTGLSTIGAQTVTANLGASVTRALVGPHVVSPGTATRELVIRLVRSSADPIRVSVYFHGAFGAPGGTVTASEVSCAGATPQGPTGAFWLRLTPPIGVPVELRCTAVLANATAYDASYMPLVIVARDAPPVVSGPHTGRTSHDVAVDVLGTVTAQVTPLAGVVAEATVTMFAQRVLTLEYRNARVIPTRLVWTGDTRPYLDQSVTLGARLTDAVTGAVLSGHSVELRAGPITRVVTTDAAGVASVQLAAGTLARGTHPVTASFAGHGEHLAASANGSLEILPIPTTLAYTGDTSATFGFAAISARLTDSRTGASLASALLTFAVDGVASGDATTDANGTAVLRNVPLLRLLPGAHAVGVSFAGDAQRDAAATNAQLSIRGSSGKVTGAVVTASGVRAELNVRSDGTATSGQIKVAGGTLDLHLKDVRGLGISGNVAVIYAPTGDGHHLIAIVTDGGVPGTADRLLLRLNGVALTGDGSVTGGNLRILRE